MNEQLPPGPAPGPMGGGIGAPGALPPMPGGGLPGGPPMPPMPPMGGGLGGPPPLGGPPGMPGAAQPQQVMKLQSPDVWKILEKILKTER